MGRPAWGSSLRPGLPGLAADIQGPRIVPALTWSRRDVDHRAAPPWRPPAARVQAGDHGANELKVDVGPLHPASGSGLEAGFAFRRGEQARLGRARDVAAVALQVLRIRHGEDRVD